MPELSKPNKSRPDFALLLAKSKDPSKTAAPDDTSSESEPVDHAADLGMDKESVENSAVKQLMKAAKTDNVDAFKQGLKDFLEACYPQLSDQEY